MRTVRLVLGSILVYAIVAACSAASTPEASRLSADAGLLDVLSSPVPDAKASGSVSGSRLKARRYVGDDGSAQFIGWHDSARDEDCAFTLAADGSMRCLPTNYAGATGYFGDAACSIPIVIANKGCPSPKSAVVPDPTSATCDGGPEYHVHPVGTVTTGPFYSKANGMCAASANDPFPTYDKRALGAEIAPSQFVNATMQIDP